MLIPFKCLYFQLNALDGLENKMRTASYKSDKISKIIMAFVVTNVMELKYYGEKQLFQ